MTCSSSLLERSAERSSPDSAWSLAEPATGGRPERSGIFQSRRSVRPPTAMSPPYCETIATAGRTSGHEPRSGQPQCLHPSAPSPSNRSQCSGRLTTKSASSASRRSATISSASTRPAIPHNARARAPRQPANRRRTRDSVIAERIDPAVSRRLGRWRPGDPLLCWHRHPAAAKKAPATRGEQGSVIRERFAHAISCFRRDEQAPSTAKATVSTALARRSQ